MLYENSQESCVITKKFAVFIAFRKKINLKNEQSIFRKQNSRQVESHIDSFFVFLKIDKFLLEI